MNIFSGCDLIVTGTAQPQSHVSLCHDPGLLVASYGFSRVGFSRLTSFQVEN